MNKLQELYELLMYLTDKNNKDNYDYLRFIVQNCERDYMTMLLHQLEKMNVMEEE